MSKNINEYSIKRFGSAEDYLEIKGKEVRLAIVKANDLYYAISEARLELSYVESEYYKENSLGVKLARYMHLKNAIQDLNRAYDIALQIPWFLFRIWNEEKTFIGKNAKNAKKDAKEISRNNEEWVSKAEKLCNYYYVINYLESTGFEKNKKLVKMLKKFQKEHITNKDKNTIRELCNYIKHKGNIQPRELSEKTKFKATLNGVPLKGDIPYTIKKESMPDNIKKKIDVEPIAKFIDKENEFVIDIIYDKETSRSENNFYGKDILKRNLSFDEMHIECISYLEDFKPIYDLYMEILEEYSWNFIPKSKIKNTTEIYMNELYQKP